MDLGIVPIHACETQSFFSNVFSQASNSGIRTQQNCPATTHQL